MKMATDNLPQGWTKCLSKKYQKHFYYHAASKRSVWVHPSLLKDKKDKILNGDAEDALDSQANSQAFSGNAGSVEELSLKDREHIKKRKEEKNARIANWAQGIGVTTETNNKISKAKHKKHEELSTIEKRNLKIQAKKAKLQKLLEEAGSKKNEEQSKVLPLAENQAKICKRKLKSPEKNTRLTPAMRKVMQSENKKKESSNPSESADKQSRYASYTKKNSTTLNKIPLKHKLSKSTENDVKKLKATVLSIAKSDVILNEETSKKIKELKPIPRKVKSRNNSASSMNSVQSRLSDGAINPFLANKTAQNNSGSKETLPATATSNLFSSLTSVSGSTTNIFQTVNNPFQNTMTDNIMTASQEKLFFGKREQASVFQNVSRRSSFQSDHNSTTFYVDTDLYMQDDFRGMGPDKIANQEEFPAQVDEGMEIDDAAEMSREIMKEIRGIREENVVARPEVNTEELTQELPAYSDPLYIVVDTNILLSHLKFISELKDYPFPGVGAPFMVIPWMVLQELDNLKDAVNRRHAQVNEDGIEEKSQKLNSLARQAIKFISSCLQGDHPRVIGESVIEASKTIDGFVEETNDDSIIHCCLGLKTRAVHSHIVLLSNDKNLCNKSMVMGIKAFSQQSVLLGLRSLFQSGTVAVRKENFEEYFEEYKVQEILAKRRKQADDTSCEIQCILREGFSSIIETEMKEAYGDELWLKIVKITPPWTLNDVFTLLQRHWIAVFGLIVNRALIKHIEELKKKFISGEGSPGNLETVKEMLELSLKIFEGFTVRSSYEDMLTKCLTGVKVLLVKCQEYINQAVPLKTLPSARAIEGTDQETGQTINHLKQTTTRREDEQKDLLKLTSYERVMETFNAIWKVVTHFSALIFYSVDFPSALIKELDPNEPKPSTQEALACLSTMAPCLLNLIKMLQGVIHIPVEGLAQQEESILNLLSAIYSFMKDVMKQDCSIKPQELLQFCQDSKTRTALVQGLSQLDRSYATLQQCAEYHQGIR